MGAVKGHHQLGVQVLPSLYPQSPYLTQTVDEQAWRAPWSLRCLVSGCWLSTIFLEAVTHPGRASRRLLLAGPLLLTMFCGGRSTVRCLERVPDSEHIPRVLRVIFLRCGS